MQPIAIPHKKTSQHASRVLQQVVRFVGSLLLVFVMAYGVLFAIAHIPYFFIEQVTVEGEKTIQEEEIQSFIQAYQSKPFLLFIPRTSSLFMNDRVITRQLLRQYPHIESLSLKKDISTKTLALSIQERSVSSLVCNKPRFSQQKKQEEQRSCWFVDKHGIAYKNAHQWSTGVYLSLVPHGEVIQEVPFQAFEVSVYQALLSFGDDFSRSLENQGVFTVHEIVLDEKDMFVSLDTFQEKTLPLRAFISFDQEILFDTSLRKKIFADMDIALTKARVKERLEQQSNGLYSIDARFPEKLYVVFQDSQESLDEQNLEEISE